VRQLLGLGTTGDSLDGARAAKVGERPLIAITEDPPPDVAEVIAEGVARIL
jgi:hypothetical protein